MTTVDLQLRADRLAAEKPDILTGLPLNISGTITGDSAMNCTRENNNNWRGGRVKTQHGYILIRVGTKHPLADCRGYAYEHRLVMFKKLGRQLERHEKIHHIDGDRTNNVPDNLMLVFGNAEHYFEHRDKSSNLRKPHEPNLVVECACGCGKVFPRYDEQGRPRKYVSGHNVKERCINVR